MSKITIGLDNTADLGDELNKKHGFKMVNMGVVIGDKIYKDCDLTPQDIYDAVEKQNIVPKTNAALETDYQELFENATKNGGEIIHFSIGDKLSASHGNAKRAAMRLERATVIDSKHLSVATGMLAMKAKEMFDEGKSVTEVVEKVNIMRDKIEMGFIINDLKYLYKGGRVTGLKLLGANLLKIRPSLEMNDGKLVPGKKFKGDFAKAVKEYSKFRIDQAGGMNAIDDAYCIIGHSDIDEAIIQGFEKDMQDAGFKKVIRLMVGTTITTHCGRNTVGLAFVRK